MKRCLLIAAKQNTAGYQIQMLHVKFDYSGHIIVSIIMLCLLFVRSISMKLGPGHSVL